MSNVIQFRPSYTVTLTAGAPAFGPLGVTIPFPSIEEIESLAIDDAAAEGDLISMLRMATTARSADARSRASVWLEEVVNVRVV